MRQTTNSHGPGPAAAFAPVAPRSPGGLLAKPAAVLLGPAAPAEWLAVAIGSVAEHLALDEALLEAAHEGRLTRPVVRTWTALKPTVVVGSSSRIDDEVDRAACVAAGVPILRRPSGGLTVVLGPGCVMWSVVAPLTAAAAAIDRIHSAVLEPLAAALVAAGRPILRRGSSDLALATADGERKVSGNALRLRRGGVLYHGTLLDDFNLDLVGHLLRHPPREPSYRAHRNHAAFLANLELGRTASDTAVRLAFTAADERISWPRARVAELVRDRYSSRDWTERLG